VAASDIKKLKEGGINTVEALAHATKRELCAIKGISEAKVVKLQIEGESALPCESWGTCVAETDV
jgi:predicted RecB family nuclease